MGTKANVPFRWAVTTVDNDGNESGVTAYSFYSTTAPIAPSNTMEEILVVPNPYRQVSGFPDRAEEKRLAFVNVPSKCTIRIYTFAGDLVKEIEHDGFGLETWGSVEQENYMLTEFNQNVAPGVYLFHVTNHTSGHEGEEYTGKFTIIK
jgi:hypothetical protein